MKFRHNIMIIPTCFIKQCVWKNGINNSVPQQIKTNCSKKILPTKIFFAFIEIKLQLQTMD